MENFLAQLLQLNQICEVHDGQWLSKALLAPKSHQEDVHNINNFVWYLCINYIPLNMVTHVIAYPIPCCGSAINLDFGQSKIHLLMDTPQGYHQIQVKPSLQE